MDIQWIGSPYFDKGRSGVKPFVIVNHVSTGSLTSMDNWFNDKSRASNPNDGGSSATFGVGIDGTIHQYVKIEDKAWAQGIPIPEGLQYATAPVVKDMNCNPNFYCVSIEREGYYIEQKDGSYTGDPGWLDGSNIPDAQFYAICWLHRYIMDYCNNTFGVNMDLGKYNVIGHFQIDPRRRPNCPGVNFPWDKLYAELAIAQKMTLHEYEMRLQYKQEPMNRLEYCVKVRTRIENLYQKSQKGQWTDLATDKLVAIGKYMESQDLMDE